MIKKQVNLLLTFIMVLVLCSCGPVMIETNPSGAEIYDDSGALAGTTPYKTEMFLSARSYTIKKDGYHETNVTVSSETPKLLNLNMDQKMVIVYSKPTAEVYPLGSDTSIGRTPIEVPMYVDARVYTLKSKDYYDQDVTVELASEEIIISNLKLRPFVVISAKPDGVEVYENNKLVGIAPVREEIVTSRIFEFRKAGYFPEIKTVKGVPPYKVAVELKPFPVISIETTPANAEIYRDNKLLTNAPAQLAVSKKITVEVRAPRYYSQTIDISPDSSKQTRVNLKAQPFVMISSQPSGAEVFKDNMLVGTTPIELLIEKESEIELSKNGFVTQRTTLTGKNNQIEVTLKEVPVEPVVAASTNQTDDSEIVDDVVAAPKIIPAEKTKKTSSNSKYLIAILGAAAIAIAAVLLIMRKK